MSVVVIEDYVRASLQLGAHHRLDFSKLKVAFTDHRLEQLTMTALDPIRLDSITVENDSSVAATQRYANSKTTVEGTKWITIKGLRVSASADIKFEPITLHTGTDYNISHTSEQSTTKTHSWDWQLNLTVPPRSRLTTEILIAQCEYTYRYSAIADISGSFTVQAPPPAVRRILIKVQPTTHNFATLASTHPHPSFTPIDGSTIRCPIEASVQSVTGTAYSVKNTETPLGHDGPTN